MHRNQVNRWAFTSMVVFLVIALPSIAMAGPWTKNPGEFYLKVGESFYRATSYRTGSGIEVSGTDYFSATSYLYAEAGIWENLHLQTYIPLMYSRAAIAGNSFSDFGPGDAQFAIQSSPLRLPFPTSVRLEARVPLYGPPPTPQTPARGGQQLDAALWLSAGGGLSSMPLYFYADLGYRYRSDITFDDTVVPSYADSFVGLAQVGYTVADMFILALNSSIVLPVEEDLVTESYVTVGPSIFWPLTELIALEFDGYLTPYSRNSAEGWSVGFGLSFRQD